MSHPSQQNATNPSSSSTQCSTQDLNPNLNNHPQNPHIPRPKMPFPQPSRRYRPRPPKIPTNDYNLASFLATLGSLGVCHYVLNAHIEDDRVQRDAGHKAYSDGLSVEAFRVQQNQAIDEWWDPYCKYLARGYLEKACESLSLRRNEMRKIEG